MKNNFQKYILTITVNEIPLQWTVYNDNILFWIIKRVCKESAFYI